MIEEKGFSLLELLTVVAILAILAAIAYPMYQNYTIRAACDNGKAGLLQLDGTMNQLRVKYGKYDNDGVATIPSAIPFDGSSSSPEFNVTIEKTATTYTITATIASTGRLAKYAGDTLTINQKGERSGTINGIDVWSEGCSSLK